MSRPDASEMVRIAGKRLLRLATEQLKGVVDLDEDQQDRLRALGSAVAENQLLALTNPARARTDWELIEASIENWKQVALGRSEAARLRMRSAILEFLSTATEVATKLAGGLF